MQSFSPNHIDFDFNRYSSIVGSFRMYSNVKKEIFLIWKKSERRQDLLVTSSFCFSFFQIQNIYFFTFEYIEKAVQNQGGSIKIKVEVVWKEKDAGAFFTFPAGGGFQPLVSYHSS